MTKSLLLGAAASLLLAGAASAADGAHFMLKDTAGADIGTVAATDTADGLKLSGSLTGLTAGKHGFHIHAVGACETPDFKSAGGHFNPAGTTHGHHAGDLPNLEAGADGTAAVDVVAKGVTLADLMDADGASLVVHAGEDDMVTDPAGNSGDRVACGVLQAGM